MVKIAYIVLDGAPDGLSAKERALELASKPNIDSLARRSMCGLAYILGRGIAPESDAAVMSLLGYDPERYYPGRGPLEAIGAGISLQEGELAMRANFATIDTSSYRIIDRRAGRRLETSEARALASSLDGMKLDDGRAHAVFRATIGHRGVLVIRHSAHRLSGLISNTDPAYERRGRISVALNKFEPYLRESKPLDDSYEARLAARLVNEFTRKAIEVLDGHEVNKERRARGLPPANAVLLRDAGDSPPQAEPIQEKFGARFASIVEMVVERGIARALGLNDIPVDVEAGASREEAYRLEARLASRALEDNDVVYVHLKGPDEPGHDGDLDGKVRAIEEIDKFFFGELLDRVDPDATAFIVTSDHSTPWHLKAHSDDPVPVMLSAPILNRGHERFTETECSRGELGVIEKGYYILPRILDILRGQHG
ncbi:MAG: 2,3-bisphosphoglycerate-independent phosphoglycerate mutase [Desulfurococcales archaeon]|nr:2,3-bisphosphoglycerate-independent phosphoglycerate mutase [Desulfurococcales archaeon]